MTASPIHSRRAALMSVMRCALRGPDLLHPACGRRAFARARRRAEPGDAQHGARLRATARRPPRTSCRSRGSSSSRASTASKGARRSRPGCFGIVLNVAPRTRRAKRAACRSRPTTSDPSASPGTTTRAGPATGRSRRCPGRADALETAEALRVIREAIDALPEAQREVITTEQTSWAAHAGERCNALGIEDTNQRVLLHRARTRCARRSRRHSAQRRTE